MSLTAAAAVLFSLAAKTPRDRADGVFLRNVQERDTVLVGDRLQYGVRMSSVPDGTALLMPEIVAGPMAGDSLEVTGGWVYDTLKVSGRGDKASRDMEISMELVPFESGNYLLPPVSLVRVDPGQRPDTLRFDPVMLEVKEIQIDTTTYVPHDIRPQIKYPLTAAEVFPWICAIWAVALLAILCWAIPAMLKSRRGGASAKPSDPPHIVALRRLDTLRGNRYWAPDKQKILYAGATDALREYISERYGFGAKEMTTAEIFAELKTAGLPADLYDGVKALFENSDMVKFAKASMPDEYNARVVPTAVRFVTETYRAEVEEEEDVKKE